MNLTELEELRQKWLQEGWPKDVVDGTIDGMMWDILAEKGWAANKAANEST